MKILKVKNNYKIKIKNIRKLNYNNILVSFEDLQDFQFF